MDLIDSNDLRQLAQVSDEHAVSLYLPLYHGAQSTQNKVRLRNLHRSAVDALAERGLRRPHALERLTDLEKLAGDPAILDAPAESLAAFFATGTSIIRLLPFRCAEHCATGRHLHVLPMLPWFAGQASYFVLAVSQKSVRFFRGTREGLEEQTIDQLPAALGDTMNDDDRQAVLQGHSVGSGSPGTGGLIRHGHGGAADDEPATLEVYLRAIDRALADELRMRTEPLIFAGVEYLYPMYKEFSTYAHLLPEPIVGNPELWSAADLHARAWPLVETLIKRRRENDLAKYGDCLALGRASDQIEEILPAANLGAVATLFIDPDDECRGTFDAAGGTVRLAEQVEGRSLTSKEENLLNLAAVYVLRNSGAVDTPGRENIPGGGPVAAVMRYPFRQIIENLAHAGPEENRAG
jgi:hypothetical protein